MTWHIKKIDNAGILSVLKSGKSGHYYIKSGLESFIIENLPDEIKENLEFEKANLT